jgi:hypothetical protein
VRGFVNQACIVCILCIVCGPVATGLLPGYGRTSQVVSLRWRATSGSANPNGDEAVSADLGVPRGK